MANVNETIAQNRPAPRQARRQSLAEQLWRADKIGDRGWHAYKRFARDWREAQEPSMRTGRFEHVIVGEGRFESRTECRLMAEQAMQAAQDAIGGRPLRALLMMVRNDTIDLASIGTELTSYQGKMQAQAAGLTLLQEAFDRLAAHYDPG